MAVAQLVTFIVIAIALVGISGTLKRMEAHNARFEPAPPEQDESCDSAPCSGCGCHAPEPL